MKTHILPPPSNNRLPHSVPEAERLSQTKQPMKEGEQISVVLASANGLERKGMVEILGSRANVVIVGQCSDGITAFQLIQSAKPTFAILDFDLPKLHCLDVTRKSRAALISTKIIVLAPSGYERMVHEAVSAGVDGFLLKEGSALHLLDSISYVRDGGTYLSPLLSIDVINKPRRERSEKGPIGLLSPRELEVFSLLVDGLRNKDIAGMLNISPKTIDTYRASLMRKLGLSTLVGLVKFAIQNNLTAVTGSNGPQDVCSR